MIHNFRPLVYDFSRSGGEWLGSARTWMQCNYINGETVFWGTQEELKGATRVSDIEQLAAIVARKVFSKTVDILSTPYRILEIVSDLSIEYDSALKCTNTYKAGSRIKIILLNHNYVTKEVTYKTPYGAIATIKLNDSVRIMPYENSL